MNILFIVYTEFHLVWLCRKLLACRKTLESIPGTNKAYHRQSVALHNRTISRQSVPLMCIYQRPTGVKNNVIEYNFPHVLRSNI